MKFKTTIFAALMGFAMLASLDANAGQQCINSHDGTLEARKNPRVGPNSTLYGDVCNTWRPAPIVTPQPTHPPKHGSKWQVCINGVDIRTGGGCWNNPNWHHGHGHQTITLRGPQAFDVLRNGYILRNNTDWNGWSTYLVKYHGHRYHSRMYNCRVSPSGNWVECTAIAR